jgi:hypothetical protein
MSIYPENKTLELINARGEKEKERRITRIAVLPVLKPVSKMPRLCKSFRGM